MENDEEEPIHFDAKKMRIVKRSALFLDQISSTSVRGIFENRG